MAMNSDLRGETDLSRKGGDPDLDAMEDYFMKETGKGKKIAEKHGTPGKDNKNVRGVKNLSKEERAERFYNLLDENIKLKTHQALLDGELVKTGTRLQRIKEMIARERKLNGGNFGIGFGKQIDEIIDTNTELSLDNDKLRSIIKGLKARMAEMIRNGYTKPGMGNTRGYVSGSSAYRPPKRKGASKGGKRPASSFRKSARRLNDDIGNPNLVKDKDLAITKLKESLETQASITETLQKQVEKLRNEKRELKDQIHDLAENVDDRDKELHRLKGDLNYRYIT